VKAVIAAAIVAALITAASATAALVVTGKNIKNGTIELADLSTKAKRALKGQRGRSGRSGVRGLPGPQGAQGAAGVAGSRGDKGDKGEKGDRGDKGDKGEPGFANLEADGPYPGATSLQDLAGGWQENGANSTELWTTAGNGVGNPAKPGMNGSWVMCPQGKVALGGGFGDDDLAVDTERTKNIVTSSPVQIIVGGTPASPTFEIGYEPIPGDTAGSFEPNGWLVEGFIGSTGGVVVRPWVTCAEAS
jgi:hypothetical protein